MNFWEQIEHFKPVEFADEGRPDSGLLMEEKLVVRLDLLADRAGHEIVILAGFARSGHAPDSFHYKGMAADFYFGRSRKGPEPAGVFGFREQMRMILSLGVFNGVGFYPEWKPRPGFHVDVRPREMFQVWKKVKGEYIYLFS